MDAERKDGFYSGDSGDENDHEAKQRQRENDRHQPMRRLSDHAAGKSEDFPEPS